MSFFFVADKYNLFLPCSKAVDCANSMIKVIKEGINEILEVNDYPEINVRVGIDVDENAIVQYNIKTNCTKDIKEKRRRKTNYL